jgi:hypothetical protein
MFHFSISVSCVLCVLPFLSFFRFLLTTNFVSSSLFSLLVAKIPLFWILSCVCFLTVIEWWCTSDYVRLLIFFQL